MGISAGLIGLPNAGKSTLFNALTTGGAEVGHYPFTTVGRNVSTLPVPDERLGRLATLTRSPKVTPTFLETVDIAGLVRGAHRGEGLGNQFLAHIREVDIILHVVRCFHNSRVVHVDGVPDPVRDVETVETELALADLATIERRLENTQRKAKSGKAEDRAEVAALGELADSLARGRLPIPSSSPITSLVRELFLLTAKPCVYVGNLSDRDYATAIGGDGPKGWIELIAHARSRGSPAVPVSAAVEAEWAELPAEERAIWRRELGDILQGGATLVKTAYDCLGLITFYTINENEARAHTIARGIPAVKAAGKVHTDLERGFVRAEVVSSRDLERVGSLLAAKQQGLVRTEGRDYIVGDGDIIQIRFAPTG